MKKNSLIKIKSIFKPTFLSRRTKNNGNIILIINFKSWTQTRSSIIGNSSFDSIEIFIFEHLISINPLILFNCIGLIIVNLAFIWNTRHNLHKKVISETKRCQNGLILGSTPIIILIHAMRICVYCVFHIQVSTFSIHFIYEVFLCFAFSEFHILIVCTFLPFIHYHSACYFCQ